MLVLFVAGLAGCLLPCHEESVCAEADSCVFLCLCQDLHLPTVGISPPGVVGMKRCPPSDELLTLPLFADSIFQPPRA